MIAVTELLLPRTWRNVRSWRVFQLLKLEISARKPMFIFSKLIELFFSKQFALAAIKLISQK